MPEQPLECVDVLQPDLRGCATPREFLDHPKVAQFARIWNRRRVRIQGDTKDYTVEEILANGQLTDQFANFAMRAEEGVRIMGINVAERLGSRIRSVQYEVNRIQWGQTTPSSLNNPLREFHGIGGTPSTT